MGRRLLAFLFCSALGLHWNDVTPQQQRPCSYVQYIEPGKMFSVNNPGFPNPYQPYSSCSWEGYTKDGATVEVECQVVNLVKTTYGGCLDYLTITSDDRVTENCRPFKATGKRVKMFLQSRTGRGGHFQCTFKATANQLQDVSGQGCDCGWNKKAQRTRVVGGQETEIHEFPSMVAFVHISSRSMWCGGTIISPRAVLTAAHCTAGRNPVEYGLLVGEHDTTKGSETSSTALMRVSKFINHGDYNPLTQAHDIALALTSRDIFFNENVGPACLPFNFQTPTMKHLTVAGWGLDEFGGSLSDVLMKANLKVMPHNFCARSYDHYDPMNQICTYERGKDACQYDSGGPLYDYNSAQKQFVMGVVSYGKDCGRLDPAVNTRVSSYLNWIQSQLPSERFCKMSE